MSLSSALESRCEGVCELCGSNQELKDYTVPPKNSDELEYQVAVCVTCLDNMANSDIEKANYWRCLNDSMWSQVPAIQVVVYRIFESISSLDWAIDLKNMMYLSIETLEWANHQAAENIIHKDSNGHVLASGDNVVLIQDLNVKGAGFTAKRGTAVRRIRLVPDNAEHIEGKVEGQQIIILTKYVKKS